MTFNYTPDINMLDQFWWYIYERQLVWHNRYILKLPVEKWSAHNKYMQKWKFCNVSPKDDRGTKYIMEKVKNVTNNKDKLFRIMFYRLFNKTETFDMVDDFIYVDKFDADKVFQIIDSARQSGKTVFTDAFMVTGCGTVKYEKTKGNKVAMVIYDAIEKDIFKNIDLYYNSVVNAKDLSDIHKALREPRMFGPFLSYVALVDVVYAGIVPFSLNDWANVGPGARKALEQIYPKIQSQDLLSAMIHLRDISSAEFKRIGVDFVTVNQGRNMELVDIEYSLCEAQKYFSLIRGNVKASKNRYFEPHNQHNQQQSIQTTL